MTPSRTVFVEVVANMARTNCQDMFVNANVICRFRDRCFYDLKENASVREILKMMKIALLGKTKDLFKLLKK